MPDRCFRMLVYGPSGSGKTNHLLDMIYRFLYFDKIYLYVKNLQESKYQHLIDLFEPISQEAGYPIIEARNYKIIALDKMPCDNQKLVIFSIQEQRMMLKLGIILIIPEIKTAVVSIYPRAIMVLIKQSDWTAHIIVSLIFLLAMSKIWSVEGLGSINLTIREPHRNHMIFSMLISPKNVLLRILMKRSNSLTYIYISYSNGY